MSLYAPPAASCGVGRPNRGNVLPFLALLSTAALLAGCLPAPETATGPPPTRPPVRLGPTSTSPPPSATAPSATVTPTLVPLEPVGPNDWQRGPSDAPVTLLLYTDVHCLTCMRLHNALRQILERHPDDVRLVVRQFPLIENRPLAGPVSEALFSAGGMGAFWDLYDFLTDHYSEWVTLDEDQFIGWLESASLPTSIDQATLIDDLTNNRYADHVEAVYRTRLAQGVPGVPLLLINSEPFPITADPISLEAAVRLAILSARQYPFPPERVIDPDSDYLAELELDVGVIIVQLFAQEAPLAVNSFIFLAREGWYDGSPVTRIIPDRLIELGDPTGTGLGDPGFYYPSETGAGLSFDRPGMVGMTNSGPGTTSGRFFITLEPMPSLDDSHTILGRVVNGLDHLAGLPAHDASEDLLDPLPITLLQVRIRQID